MAARFGELNWQLQPDSRPFSDGAWPTQAWFWLEWGSSTAEHIPLRFAEQQLNMLRPDYVLVNVEPETAPRVPHPKIALFAILG